MQVGLLQAGEIYRTTYQGPYGHQYAAALNVILNVNFNVDGSGGIGEGSYYPIEELDSVGSEKPMVYDETRVLIRQN